MKLWEQTECEEYVEYDIVNLTPFLLGAQHQVSRLVMEVARENLEMYGVRDLCGNLHQAITARIPAQDLMLEFPVPATWWEHLKLRLRSWLVKHRWPGPLPESRFRDWTLQLKALYPHKVLPDHRGQFAIPRDDGTWQTGRITFPLDEDMAREIQISFWQRLSSSALPLEVLGVVGSVLGDVLDDAMRGRWGD